MTLREVLAALWRRKWIIVAVTLLAVMVAGVYLARVEPNYTSSTTARASTFLTDSILAGSIAGTPADVDPSVITTPAILEPAAEALGEPVATVAANVEYQVVEGLRTNTVVVTATGPTPAAAQERAQAVMQSYIDYLDGVVGSTLATLQQNVTATTDQIRAYQAQLAGNPDDPIAAQNLATALSTLSGYNAQIVLIQNAGGLLTVTTAATPGASTNPSLPIVVALALLCGLLAGAGVALIRDFFDDRIRSSDEIEGLTGAPAIAELANDRRVARKRVRLPAASAERTALSEGIRSLRTTVQVMLPEGKGAIVITSVEPGDGKTFLSTNLAVSWARAGRKAILVGGDLRRGQLGSYFPGMDQLPGLGDLLSDAAANRRAPSQAQIVDALQSTQYRGLRIMPAGTPDDEPADLLGGRHLGKVIAQLTRAADVVVIDSPPALALADASELAANAVGVILIATVGRTRRGLLTDTTANLRANGIEVLGVVVNRSRRRLPKSYGSYYVARGSARPAVAKVKRSEPQPLEDDDALLALDEGADNAARPKRSGEEARRGPDADARMPEPARNDDPDDVAEIDADYDHAAALADIDGWSTSEADDPALSEEQDTAEAGDLDVEFDTGHATSGLRRDGRRRPGDGENGDA